MQRWLALGCGVVVGNSDFWIFFSPVFLNILPKDHSRGRFGEAYKESQAEGRWDQRERGCVLHQGLDKDQKAW